MVDITSANAVLTISVATVFPVPQQMEGFATDDIYDVPQIRSAEVLMGVDGKLSGAFVFVQVPQTLTFQADSPSNAFFDTWWLQNQAAKSNFVATGLILLPAVATKFGQTKGFLTGYKPVPGGKRTLQPRTYEITWERIAPAPV